LIAPVTIPSYAQWVPSPTSCTCYRRTLARRATVKIPLGGAMAGRRRCGTGREPCLTLAKRFSRVSGTRHKVSVFGSGTLENKPVVWFGSARTNSNGGGERMLLYEMVIAIGIAVLLVVAAIGGLAARIMMGPEEMALLRAARATAAQRRLVAAAAQQERAARAA